MRRLSVVVVVLLVVVGCGSGPASTTSTGGAPGTGGQLGSGGSAGSTSTGGSAGNGQAGAAGGAAAGSSGAAGAAGNPGTGGLPAGGAGGQSAAAGAAGGAAGAAGHAAGGAAGGGGAGAAGHAAGGAAGGAAGAAGPSCGAPPAPSTTCNSLSVAGPCVLPTFVVGSWPAGTFSSGTTPKMGTYQLTAVTYYGAAADAGAGFACEGSPPLRETIGISGFAPTFNLQVAQAETGISLAVQNGSFAPMSSSYSDSSGSLPTSYAFAPSCASGTGTNTTMGGWGATSTTVTLSGFTRVGCLHGGKLQAGREVDTFALAP